MARLEWERGVSVSLGPSPVPTIHRDDLEEQLGPLWEEASVVQQVDVEGEVEAERVREMGHLSPTHRTGLGHAAQMGPPPIHGVALFRRDVFG